jgi:hypothetical protein
VKRTSAADLVAALVVTGGIAYVLLRRYYGSLPPLGYLVPVPLAVLAVAEFVAARRVRAVVRHDPQATPLPAIVIARLVALGKASSLVGSAAAGAAGALLARVIPSARSVDAAGHDTRVGVLALLAAAALVAAGLLLERAGVSPDPPAVARR